MTQGPHRDPPTVALDSGSVPRSLDVDPELIAERELLLLLHDFEIGERLGAGAMGAVWAAVDRRLDRKVAIKLLRPGRHGPKGGERMFREARSLARLSHPNVVAIHETGRIVHGLPIHNPVYIVMEHVEGATLAAWVAEGPRAWEEIVEVFIGAGRGLAAAHDAGLIHRDFKPANVLIEYRGGTAKVADFGLALDQRCDSEGDGPLGDAVIEQALDQTVHASRSLGRLTRRGGIIGTPAYMAPEQLRGLEATAASDQFGFCVCLWEALHHTMPWEFSSIADLISAAKHARLIPGESVPSLPRWLERVLRRGLATEPEARFEDMHALLRELEDGPRRRRRRGLVFGLGVSFVIVAGLTGWWGAAQARQRAEAARSSSCVGALADTREIWNDKRHAALRVAFGGVGGPPAIVQADRVAGLIEGRTRLWIDERRALCDAAAKRGSTPAEQLVGACLDERSAELQVIIEILLSPSSETIEDALKIFHDNVVLGPCEGSTSLRMIPEDPARRREYIVLRSELARLRALRERATDTHVDALTAQIRAFDHDALTAALALLEADRSGGLGDFAAEEATLNRGFEAAVRVGDEGLTLEVLGRSLRLLALQHRIAETDWPLRYGDLVDARLGASDPIRSARWRNHKAILAFYREDYPKAATLFAEAVALFTEIPEGEVLSLGPLSNLATASRHLGQNEQARALYLRTLEIEQARYGADSSRLMVHYTGLALLDMNRDTKQARQWLEKAHAVLSADPEARRPSLALTLGNFALLAVSEGAYTQALEQVARAHEQQAGMAGGRGSTWLSTELIAVDALLALGRLAEAQTSMQATEQAIVSTYGDDYPNANELALTRANLALAQGQLDVAHDLYTKLRAALDPGIHHGFSVLASINLGLATIAFARGEFDEAEREATTGVALGVDVTANVNVLLPTLQLLLAELLWQRPDVEPFADAMRREQALELARTAQHSLRAAEPTEGRALLLGRVNAWLAENLRDDQSP